MNYTITSCFDWFQVVFDHIPYYDTFDVNLGKPKSFKVLNEILYLLKIPEDFYSYMADLDKGFFSYKFRIELLEGITIHLFGPKNSNDKYTTLLQISGIGCKFLFENKLWFNFYKYCIECNAKFTRLDCATDIKGEYPLNMWVIYNCITKGMYKSIYTKGYIIIGVPPTNEYEAKVNSLTIYAGKKGSSSSFTRIYNKAVEQGLDPLLEPWIRVEMQIQDSTKIRCIINAFMLAYSDDDFNIYNSVVLGTLNDFLVLLDEDGEVHPLWSGLLKDIKAIKLLSSPKSSNSFDTCYDWFNRSCASVLAKILLVYGEIELIKLVKELSYTNLANFDRKSLNCVNEKLNSLGFKMLKLDDVKKIGKDNLEIRNIENE